MARPKVALISRDSTVKATLGLLEAEGLDNFSLRRLAQELNVNQASFYHHFDGRADILESAARAALSEVDVPPHSDDWIDWMATVGLNYRRFLIERPYLVDIMLGGFRPRTEVMVYAEARLAELGVARMYRIPILEALESMVVGSALVAIMGRRRDGARARTRRSKTTRTLDAAEQLLMSSHRILLMSWLDDPALLGIDPAQVETRTATPRRTVKRASSATRTDGSTPPRAGRDRPAARPTTPSARSTRG